MKIATVELKSISPYSQSRHHDTPKVQRESDGDYRDRTWRNSCHVNSDGNIIIPPTALKNCLSEAAKYLAMQIPGKGKTTYTKHFEAGVLVADPMVLAIKQSEVESERLFLPPDGKRGGPKRVWKVYPVIHEWHGTAIFFILDETVTQTMPDSAMTVFEHHLRQSGSFIGIGRFRPRNNGYYGRFTVESIEWSAA